MTFQVVNRLLQLPIMSLEDDRAEKVCCVSRCGSSIRSSVNPTDVLPQRLPLLFFLPDIRALEQWHERDAAAG